MVYAVMADVHASIEALTGVMEHARRNGVDKFACCGDLVGYYTDPNECIEMLQENDAVCVRGNHDVGAVGIRQVDGWWLAIEGIAWTRRRLTVASRDYLLGLPETTVVDGEFLMFHGALHAEINPEDVYLKSVEDAEPSLRALATHPSGLRLGFHGHTHEPAVFEFDGQRTRKLPGESFTIAPDRYYLVNPGSVGQPRDGDPRASYATYDVDRQIMQYHRVPFDVARRDRKARRRGLGPNPLRRRIRRFLIPIAKRALRRQ